MIDNADEQLTSVMALVETAAPDPSLVERALVERRYEVAKSAIAELSLEQRATLLADLVRQVESNGQPRRAGRSAPPPSRPAAVVSGESTFVDKAEAFVAAHPGSTTSEVATGVGQSRRAVDGTLRHLARSRHTVERRDRRWWPTSGNTTVGPRAAPTKLTNRAAIIAVLGKGKPLGTSDIFHAVVQVLPKVLRASVATEVNRMKEAGLVVERGTAGRGPAYVLADGACR